MLLAADIWPVEIKVSCVREHQNIVSCTGTFYFESSNTLWIWWGHMLNCCYLYWYFYAFAKNCLQMINLSIHVFCKMFWIHPRRLCSVSNPSPTTTTCTPAGPWLLASAWLCPRWSAFPSTPSTRSPGPQEPPSERYRPLPLNVQSEGCLSSLSLSSALVVHPDLHSDSVQTHHLQRLRVPRLVPGYRLLHGYVLGDLHSRLRPLQDLQVPRSHLQRGTAHFHSMSNQRDLIII